MPASRTVQSRLFGQPVRLHLDQLARFSPLPTWRGQLARPGREKLKHQGPPLVTARSVRLGDAKKDCLVLDPAIYELVTSCNTAGPSATWLTPSTNWSVVSPALAPFTQPVHPSEKRNPLTFTSPSPSPFPLPWPRPRSRPGVARPIGQGWTTYIEGADG